MIIVKVYGGLGNQIFQYIFGKFLEYNYGYDVMYDLEYFKKYNYRKPSLLNITTDINLLDNVNIHSKFNISNSFKINNLINSIIFKNHFFSDKTFNKSTSIKFIENEIYYFDGYWQNSQYFNFFSLNLLNTFFSIPFINNNTQNEIYVHVRRGDYYSKQNINVFYLQDIEYYSRAIYFLQSKYNLDETFTKLIVITDDKKWVDQNFNFNLKTIVYSGDDIDDFKLLSSARFLITSNSTFSISAAFINPNPDKIIITPRNWFKDPKRNKLQIDNLYSKDWVKI